MWYTMLDQTYWGWRNELGNIVLIKVAARYHSISPGEGRLRYFSRHDNSLTVSFCILITEIH